jgi:hypothetical protein
MILVLNPNIRLAYVEGKWDSEAVWDGMVRLKTVVCLESGGLPCCQTTESCHSLMNTILRPHLCGRTLLPPISVSIWLFFLLVSIIKLRQTDLSSSESTQAQYGHSWMCAAVEAWKAQDCMASHPRKELDQYLASPLEDNDSIVSWWGISFFLPYYFDDVS